MTPSPMTPTTRQSGLYKLVFPLFLCLFFGLPAAFFIWNHLQDEQAERARRAVSVLPTGVEASYQEYITRELARSFRFIDGGVLIATHEWDGDDDAARNMAVTRYAPSGSTFTCQARSGVELIFASGEETLNVTLLGVEDIYRNPRFHKREAPPLGVSIGSVAAKRLFSRLCAQAVSTIQAHGFIAGSQQDVFRAVREASRQNPERPHTPQPRP